jgi:hypothetical protein
MLRRIDNEEPTPPRKINPTIPRELETILINLRSAHLPLIISEFPPPSANGPRARGAGDFPVVASMI